MYNVGMVNPLQIFIIRLKNFLIRNFVQTSQISCNSIYRNIYLVVDDRSNQNPVLCQSRILNDRKNISREAEMLGAPFTFLRCMSLVCAHQDRKFITVTLKRLLLLLKQ